MLKKIDSSDDIIGTDEEIAISDEYRQGDELLSIASKKMSEGKNEDAKKDLIIASEKFKEAVEKAVFFPGGYYSWGEALKLLAEIDNDEALFEEAIVKYMAAGLQLIVDGRPMEKPFIQAHNIGPKDNRHKMIFALYILSIQVIKGKKIADNEMALLKDIKDALKSPPILLLLIDTLAGETQEKQTINDDDDLVSIATKLLINVAIDIELVK